MVYLTAAALHLLAPLVVCSWLRRILIPSIQLFLVLVVLSVEASVLCLVLCIDNIKAMKAGQSVATGSTVTI